MHGHYEKLLPPSNPAKTTAEFIPVPYFKEFLVIQPYKAKSILESTYLESKHTTPRPRGVATAKPASARGQEYANSFFHYRDLKNQTSGRQTHVQFSSKHSMRTPLRTATSRPDVSKIDLGFDHLFLIDKLLLSYGAQNLDQIHSILNNAFPGYIKKLHSRIPPRIVPLIWNDPIIQKLALIIATSNQIKNKKVSQSIYFFLC